MIGIVIPVYNESENIKTTFERIDQYIRCYKEVMIVYDTEEDTTLPSVVEVKNKYSFPIVCQKNKYGKGALNAIKTGMEESHGDAVVVMMADLSDSIWLVDRMYYLIKRKGYDLVCGSRYMKGGKQHGGPFLKGLFSRTAGVSLHLLSGIPTHDVTNSFKMYRKSMLEDMTIESNGGFEIGMEITVKAYLKGYRITEIPSEWFDRSDGESHFRMWEWIPHYLHWYFLCVVARFKCGFSTFG